MKAILVLAILALMLGCVGSPTQSEMAETWSDHAEYRNCVTQAKIGFAEQWCASKGQDYVGLALGDDFLCHDFANMQEVRYSINREHIKFIEINCEV